MQTNMHTHTVPRTCAHRHRHTHTDTRTQTNTLSQTYNSSLSSGSPSLSLSYDSSTDLLYHLAAVCDFPKRAVTQMSEPRGHVTGGGTRGSTERGVAVPPRFMPACRHFRTRHAGQFFLRILSMMQSFLPAQR